MDFTLLPRDLVERSRLLGLHIVTFKLQLCWLASGSLWASVSIHVMEKYLSVSRNCLLHTTSSMVHDVQGVLEIANFLPSPPLPSLSFFFLLVSLWISFSLSPSFLPSLPLPSISPSILPILLHYHNSTVSVSFPTGHILEAVALPAMALSPMSIQKPVSPCMVSTYHFPVSLPLTFDRFWNALCSCYFIATVLPRLPTSWY